jgi:hypothetical protein
MTVAASIILSIFAAAPLLAGCDGQRPKWVNDDGWHAARCKEATEILVAAGDASLKSSHEAWEQVTDPFYGTTDGIRELNTSARISVTSLFDGNAKAQRFTAANCSSDALADIRRRL